jgi:hypothetical protein
MERFFSGTGPRSTYFIQGELTGLIKIGHTRGIATSRLSQLQPNSPDKLKILKVVDQDMERFLHSMFEHQRAHGEWFRPSGGLLTLINAL